MTGFLIVFDSGSGSKSVITDRRRVLRHTTNFGGKYSHFEGFLQYQLVGYDLPQLWASFSLLQKARYYVRQLYIPYIYPLPGVKNVINFFSHKALSTILHDYRNKGTKKMNTSLKYTIF